MTDPLWKRRLRPASFRGIPFYVEAHEYAFGRNAVPFESPDKSSKFTEDTGEKTDVFSVEGYVLGDDYMSLRNALIDACKEQGPGTLVHPYLGAKEVQCAGVSLVETVRDGGIAKFIFLFLEAGEASFPFSVFDKVAGFFDSAIATVAQVQNAFVEIFSIAQLPSFAVDSASALVTRFADTVSTVTNGIRSVPNLKADLDESVNNLKNNVESLLRNADELSVEIESILDQLKTVPPDPDEEEQDYTVNIRSGKDDRLEVFRAFIAFDGGSADIPENTPTRQTEKKNARALEDLISQIALAKLSEQAVSKSWDSNDEALEMRESITEHLDQNMSSTDNDEVYQALKDMNAALTESLPNTDSGLANIKSHTPIEATPSLLLTYDLYEASDNEQDILDRNAVRHPGFVSGQLEVLSG